MKNFKTLLLCTALLSLSACGIKPGDVEPPSGKDTGFPHTYPDPALDPQ